MSGSAVGGTNRNATINNILIVGSVAFLCVLLVALTACGGGGGSKTEPPPPPAISVSVSPATATVSTAHTQTFTAAVTNTTNTAVTWSVQEGAAGGTITSGGVYTAPTAAGTYHVVATSQADATKSGTATVTVNAVGVTITPTTATLAINGAQTFTATVTNATNTSVTWSVQEGAAGGTVTNSGAYTAPPMSGTYHVVATSQADPSKSAKATVTVTAPAPVFSSAPVTDANEGDEYTYTVVATDPAEGTVAYDLTAGPQGATISGGVITWTPTQQQARSANNFTVVATTSHGGSGTQNWTVTPTGIIRGTSIVTFHTESGPVDLPRDLSGDWIAAYVPDGEGGYNLLEGAGTENSEFTIERVPAGNYWLAFNSDTFWTNSSTVDLGYDLTGRPDFATAAPGTTFSLQLTNLNPWLAEDRIQIFTPNVDSYNTWYWVDPTDFLGKTLFTMSLPWGDYSYPLLEAAKGDKTYITQLIETPVGADVLRYAGRYSGSLNVTLTDGGEIMTAVPMTNVTLSDFQLNIKGSAFDQLKAAANPNAVSSFTFLNVDAHPFGLSHGVIGSTANLLSYYPNNPITTDQNLGTFHYGNPFPAAFGKVLRYDHYFDVPVTAPDATNPSTFWLNSYQESTTMPSASSPIQPAIGPVISAKVNGQDFFTAQTITDPIVTISWQPPAIGTPTGYRLTVSEVYSDSGDTYSWDWVTFYTKTTSVVLPADSFYSGSSFVVRITAMSEPNVDFATQPYRVTAPYAQAEALSGVLTFEGSPVVFGASATRSTARPSLRFGSKIQSGSKVQSGVKMQVSGRQTRDRNTPDKPVAPVARPAKQL